MKEFLDKLYLLLKESTITQSLLVIFVFGSMCYCVVSNRTIPEVFVQYGWVIVGFFFGSKLSYMSIKGV
jgi:hypothetical protein